MTTSEYITKITNGILTLVDEEPTIDDESTLLSNEWFVLMFYTEYHSYLRNYREYRGSYNYNEDFDSYDIDIFKQGFDNGYFITKHYDKIKNKKGRVLIVSISQTDKCISLDDTGAYTPPLLDYDKNVYTTTIIGHQEWVIENLMVTHYADGTSIPYIENDLLWLADVEGAHCWYDNLIANKLHGVLYNWYAVNNAHGLCYFTRNDVKEEGWGIPTTVDWIKLFTYLGYDFDLIGGMLKEQGLIHWNSPNTGAIDSVGFRAYGAGNRFIDTYDDNGFASYGIYGDFWSSTELMPGWIATVYLDYDSAYLTEAWFAVFHGLNVRCVKNM